MTVSHGAKESSSEALAECVARGGCETCFSELVRRFQTPLVHFLMRRVGSEHDAEDLVQEAFVVAYRKIGKYRTAWKFSTWLFTIANRLAVSKARRLRISRPLGREVPDTSSNPLTAAEESEMRSRLWDTAREVLAGEAFTAIWLSCVESMPAEEIGKVLGRSANAVRILLHRARGRLARELKHDWK
jgi:RNA polymerase sigma-70 factor (ECF subfamily)